jgi:hypothetical protein
MHHNFGRLSPGIRIAGLERRPLATIDHMSKDVSTSAIRLFCGLILRSIIHHHNVFEPNITKRAYDWRYTLFFIKRWDNNKNVFKHDTMDYLNGMASLLAIT